MKQKKEKCPCVPDGCTVYLHTCPKLCSLRIQNLLVAFRWVRISNKRADTSYYVAQRADVP